MRFSSQFMSNLFLSLILLVIAGCGKLEEQTLESVGAGTFLRLEASAPGTASINQCFPVILSLLTAEGAASKASSDMNITVSGASTTEIFSDSSCLTQAPSSITWAKDQSSKAIFIKAASSQIYTLQFSEASFAVIGVFKIVQVGSASGSEELKLALSGPNSFLTGQCKAFSVVLQNMSGASRTRTIATTLSLSGLGAGSAYANSNCTGGVVTSLTLPANTSVTSFSLRSATAENLIMVVDSALTGISSALANVEVLSSAAYQPQQLAMSGVSAITAGACAGPVLVRTIDSFGNASAASANLPFTLSGNLGFSPYADAGCITPLLSPQVASGQSAMNFYFNVSSGGTLTINADDGGALLDTSLTVTASASVGGSATRIALIGPTSVTAGVCSSAYLVKTQDSSNVDYAVSSMTTVNLAGKGAGDFYSDASCTAIISSVVFSSGDSVKAFYYKSNAVGALVFNADDAGALVPGSQSVNIIAGPPTQLAISGTSPISVAACRAYLVESRDAGGYASAVSSNTPVDLTETGSGMFYSDASCSSATTSATILAGQSNATFYYKSMNAGSVTFSADDLSSLTMANLPVVVQALPATKLALSRPVLRAGTCTPMTVSLQDNLSGNVTTSSNLTVNLGGVASGNFYSNAGCSALITNTTILATNSSATIYYLNNVSQALTLTAAATGLTTDSWSTTVSPDVPTKLTLAGSATIGAGACVALSLHSRDAQNNLSPVTSATLVTFAGQDAGRFSTQSDCATTNSSLTLTPGLSAAAIYYTNNTAQAVSLSAAASGLTDGTLAVTVNAGGETKLKWTLASSTTAGTCLTGNLQVQDALNNPVNQGSARTIALSDLGAANVYTSADCSGGAVTSLTVLTGQSSVSFSLRDNTAQSLTLSASSTALSAASHALTVNAGTPNRLTLAGPASLLAGDCGAYDVRIEDTNGNLSAVGTGTTINFSGYSNARFYSDSGCSTQITATSVSSGSSQKAVYFKGTVAEALTLGASSTGLTSASKSVTIATQPAVTFAITGPASAPANSCQMFLVEARDQHGNGVVQGSSLTVDLLGQGSGTFYSDAGCATTATQVTISAASANRNFYFRSNVAESLQLRAQNATSGLSDATKTFVVQPLVPSVISLTGINTINSQTCVGYTISLLDSLGNLSPVGAAKTMNLTGAGASGAFYSDAACATSVTSTVFSSAQTSAIVYYKATSPQNVNLNVDDVGLPNLTAATLAVTVNAAGGGTGLSLRLSGASSLQTNVCSPYVVMTVDASNSSTNVSSNLTVNMAGEASGTFYSDSGCTTASPTVTITTGTSLAFTYYRNLTAQNIVMAATSTGASSTTLPVSIVNGGGAGAPSRLAWSGATTLDTQACIPYVLSLNDSNGNSVNASGAVSITLSGDGAGDFHTENTCTTSAAGAATISSGSSYTTLYFKTPSAANLVFIAQSTGLSNGTFPVTAQAPGGGNNSGPAVKLVFLQQPSNLATISINFDTQPIVGVQDSNGNVVSGASSAVTLAGFSDSACTIAAGGTLNATTNPLNAAGGVAIFSGVNQTHSQSLYLKATSPGLASACSSVVQVYPSVPARLAFTQQPPAMATAGALFSTQPQVSVLNHTGQVMPSSTNAVSLAAYLDASCTTVATDGTLSVTTNPQLPNSGVVSFAGVSHTKATTIYLKAESSGLTSTCSTGVTINPAAPDRLTFYSQPTSTLIAGATTSLQVRLQDSFGNTAPVSDTIQLTAYPSSNCTGAPLGGFSNDSANAVLGTASFTNVSETIAGVITIQATNTTNPGVTAACSNSITVQGAAAQTLTFTTEPSSTGFSYSNLLTSPVVTVTDQYGNMATAASTPVTLGAFTDASCTTSAPGNLNATVNPLGPNAGVATFSGVYYSQPGTIYLRASATGLTSDCSNAIVIGGVVSQLAVGGTHTCALANSNVYCWGANDRGQLGLGTRTGPVNTPVQVVGPGGSGVLSNIIAISASGGMESSSYGPHTCAVAASGALYCWGANNAGQLGDNTSTTSPAPVQVLGVGGSGFLTNIVKVSAGGNGPYGYTCATDSAGSAFCWGYNGYGQLGDSTTTTRYVPVQVRGVGGTGNLTNVSDISAAQKENSSSNNSQTHTCASRSDGSAYCWGYNNSGQLGDNTTTNRSAPVQVLGVGGSGLLSGIVQVSVTAYGAGNGHSCAVTSAGAVYCWGSNNIGQLGDNTTTTRTTPIQVVGTSGSGTLSGVAKVVTGAQSPNSYAYSCAVSSGGGGYCWGYLHHGGISGGPTSSYYPNPIVGVGGTGYLANLRNIAATSSGLTYSRTCALDTSGSIFCWGDRSSGSLGDGQTANGVQYTPVKTWATAAVSFSQVVTSGHHTCGIVAGNVYCWGAGGTVGDGTGTSRYSPTQVAGPGGTGYLSNIVNISTSGADSASNVHTCAVSASGQVYCWGCNSQGQLGNGTTSAATAPVLVSGLTQATKVSAGSGQYGFTCAVTSAGGLYCWGYNGSSQLGDGTTTSRYTPVQVSLSNVTEVAVSGASLSSYPYGHACAVNTSGSAYCWGYGSSGQLGDGASTGRATPTLVTGLTNVAQITVGQDYVYGYSCANTTAGSAYCWGHNGNSQLGDGTTTQRATPTQVVGIGGSGLLGGVTKISAGGYADASGYGTTCAATSAGLVCWGYGGYYETGGYPDFQNAATPRLTLLGAMGFQSVSVGYRNACGVNNVGSVYCWGYSSSGALGTGSSPVYYYAPQMASFPLPSGLSVSQVAAGANQTCAAANGSAFCWGAGTNGVLGSGATTNVTNTVQVQRSTGGSVLGIAAVSTGGTQSCALTAAGSVQCWGDNMFGNLGNNSTTASLRAVQVLGAGGVGSLGSISNLSSGFRHNCAVTLTGSVYCWGWDSSGQLGNNSTISSATPMQVVGMGGTGFLTGMSKVVTGYAHSCALSTGGEVYCWGHNGFGQLGNNTTSQSNTPVKVLSVAGNGSLSGVTAIAAGAYHTCAVSGGQVFCWGANASGQLGNDSVTQAGFPVGTLTSGYVGLTGIASLTAGATHTCAVNTANAVFCWGGGGFGQLGSGTLGDARVANQVVGVGGAGFLTGITAVAAGAMGNHTCALKSTGDGVFCWGAGGSGQLGNNTTAAAQTTPVASVVANVGVTYFVAR